MTKLQRYEQIKKEIERTAKTPQEYEKRVKALAKKNENLTTKKESD